jgi:hypothetical protein
MEKWKNRKMKHGAMQLTCFFAMLEVHHRKLQEYLWTSPIPGDFDQIRESSPFPGCFNFFYHPGPGN